MLKLSTANGLLWRRYGFEESVRILKQSGFEAYDATLYTVLRKDSVVFSSENWRDVAKEYRRIADSYGIPCNQAHAPFPSSRGDETDEEIFRSVVKSMEIASLLGAEQIVVHPKKHLGYWGNEELLKEMNLEFYRRLLPYCEQFGIKVALENMVSYYGNDKKLRMIPGPCAHPKEFCEYLDALDSPWFVACLDVGHTVVVGENLTAMIHALGPRLRALHLQDNSTERDDHTLPFHGKMDYDQIVTALAAVDYQGDLTLEADSFLVHVPKAEKEAAENASRYMCSVAETLRKMILSRKESAK